MKRVLLALALFATVGTASAQWHHGYRHWEPRTVIVERNDWVGPLILGGIAGAVIANANQPQSVVVQQPVIVQQAQVVCTDWKEIQQPDGRIYRERNCYQR